MKTTTYFRQLVTSSVGHKSYAVGYNEDTKGRTRATFPYIGGKIRSQLWAEGDAQSGGSRALVVDYIGTEEVVQ